MNILDKLRSQPEHVRKLILWITVIIVGLILGTWWIYSSYQNIKKFQTEKFMEELNPVKFAPQIFNGVNLPTINEQ